MAAPLASPSRATFRFHDGETDDVPGCRTPIVTAHADYTLDAEVHAFQLDAGVDTSDSGLGGMSAAQRQLALLRIGEEEAGDDSYMSSDSDASPYASVTSDRLFDSPWANLSPASSTASFDQQPKSASPTIAFSPAPYAASPSLARPAPLQRTASASMVRSYSNPVATQAETDASRRVWERQQAVVPTQSTLATISSPPRARSSDDLTPRSSLDERPMLAYPYSLLGSRAPTPTGAAGMYARSHAHGQATPASPTSSPKCGAASRPTLGRFMSFDPASFVRVGDAWA